MNILNQAELADIKFIPRYFNCPSRLALQDSLIVSRPEDNYYTTFDINGYNDDYKKYMGLKLIGPVNQDNYYSVMDKLEEISIDSPAYNREDFKRKAIKTYDLKSTPWVYTIALK